MVYAHSETPNMVRTLAIESQERLEQLIGFLSRTGIPFSTAEIRSGGGDCTDLVASNRMPAPLGICRAWAGLQYESGYQKALGDVSHGLGATDRQQIDALEGAFLRTANEGFADFCDRAYVQMGINLTPHHDF